MVMIMTPHNHSDVIQGRKNDYSRYDTLAKGVQLEIASNTAQLLTNCGNYESDLFNHRSGFYRYITKSNIFQELVCNYLSPSRMILPCCNSREWEDLGGIRDKINR